MALKFEITGNNKGLIESLSQSNRAIHDTASRAESEGMRISEMFDNIKKSAAGMVAGFSIAQFAKSVATTRGEFQQLEVAFKTMLGSGEKAEALLNQLVKTAATTPFDLKGVAEGAKQLMAYGTAADDVNEMLVRLGDIAAGMSIPLNDLVYLYGTTMVQGRMFTQDLRQFQGRGIPIAEEIAKILNITKEGVAEAVTAGKVTDQVLHQAIVNMTNAGGLFGGLMDAQSKTINGQISNIEDAIDMMFNDIGKSQEGVINTTLGVVSTLVENWETVGTAIMTVVAAYGEYKASLMALSAYQDMIAKQKATIEAERVDELQSLVDEYSASLNTESISAETAATEANTQAKAQNAAVIDNQVTAIQKELSARLASATASHDAAIANHEIAEQFVQESAEKVAAAEAEVVAAKASGDAERIAAAEKELATAQTNMNAAAEMKNAAAKEVQATATARSTAQQKLNTFQTQVDTAQKNANTKATGLWTAATRMCTTAMQSLKAAIASNPFGMALVAITTIIGLLSMFTSETDEAADSTERFREKVLKEKETLDTYYAVLTNVEKGSKSYNEAMNGINSMAKEYNVSQLTVNDTLEEQRQKYYELTEAIRQQTAEKTLAEAASKANQDAMSKEKDAMDELMKQASKAKYTTIEYTTIDAGDGKSIAGYGAVEHESENIRKITSATWNMISTEVMEHSRAMSDAFAKSAEDGEKAVASEVETIENVLRSIGVTDKELQEFHEHLHDYVKDSAKGFAESYNELDRTKAQLEGIANAAVNTKDTTNIAIDQMNFEQLTSKAADVQREIDAINAKEVKVDTDNTKLEALKSLLEQINKLLPTQLTAGSDAELNKRLSDLKKKRDSAVYGSDEWNEYNRQVGEVTRTLATHKKGYAETTSTSSKKSGTSKADRARQQARYEELQHRQGVDATRQAEDLVFDAREAEIDAMQEGTDKALAQLRLDFDKRKAELERGYEDLKQTKIDKARQLFEADPKNKDRVFDPKRVDTSYTAQETATFNAQMKANETEYKRGVEEANKASIEAMRNYLKEYGTVEERRLAITQEYEAKIRDARTEGEKMALQAQMESALQQFDLTELRKTLNFEDLFNNLGAMTVQQLQNVKNQLQSMMSDGSMSLEDYKVAAEQVDKVNEAILNAQDKENSFLGMTIQRAQTRRKLEMDVADAIQRQRDLAIQMAEALGKVSLSSEKVSNIFAQAGATPAQPITSANTNAIMEQASELFGKGSPEYNAVLAGMRELAKNERELAATTEKKEKVDNDAANAQSKLNQYLGDFKARLNDLMGTFDQVNANIQSLPGLLDTLGLGDTGVAKAVDDLAEGANAGMNAMKDFASGNYIGALKNGLDAVGAFGRAGIGLFAGQGNAEEMEAKIEELSKSNALLAQSIDGLRDSISDNDSTNERSLDAYKKAYEAEKEWEANQRQKIDARASEYSNSGHGFLGLSGKHSFNAYLNDRGSGWWGWKEFNRVLQENGSSARVNSAGSLWNLTPEEMKLLRDFSPSAWKELLDTDGEANPSELLNEYIERAGMQESLLNALNEKLTGYSWDGFKSSFANALTDMGSDVEDFAENMENVISNAILNALINKKYNDRINALYEQIADAAKDDEITKQEADAIRAANEAIANDMLADRQRLLDLGILNDTSDEYRQEASSKGFQAMSQDVGNELNGRFTALQIAGEQINGNVAQILGLLTTMTIGVETQTGITEIRNLMIMSNAHLEDLVTFQRYMRQHLYEYLENITRKLNNL